MNFQYSCFISYRRHPEIQKFMTKLKKIIEAEAFRVTNMQNVFFDEKTIKWGEEFDDKIYEGIVTSYFFIPMFNNVYLHEVNLWCAKELHWAIRLEERIRENIPNYCFILPLIDRGSAADFPDCIGKKNAKDIKVFRHLIDTNKTSRAFEEFKSDIYDIFLNNYNLLKKDHLFFQYLNEFSPISNEDLKNWIKEQKNQEKEKAASHLPTLTKNVF